MQNLFEMIESVPAVRELLSHIRGLFVGTKKDLCTQTELEERAHIFRQSRYAAYPYRECSALTGENVDSVFRDLVLKILDESA